MANTRCRDGRGILRSLNLFLPPLALASTIFWASSLSISFPRIVGANTDKLLHFLVFGILGLLVFRALSGGLKKGILTIIALAVTITVVYGAVDELHQSFVPGRLCEFGDFLFDALGCAFFVSVYAIASEFSTTREKVSGQA